MLNQYKDAEVEIICEEGGEARLKIWLHPETPDNEVLNPEIRL